MRFIHHLHLLETQVSEYGKQVIKKSVGRMSKKQRTDGLRNLVLLHWK